MMWSSIANLKENLHKIALDVHDDDDETLEIYNSPDRNGASDRRISHNFARSSPASHSTLANGFDSPYNSEPVPTPDQGLVEIYVCKDQSVHVKLLKPSIEQYKAEIKRLQESESEIKALSLNYAALLKEKEGGGDQSPNRQHKASIKSRSVGNRTNNGFISKHDGLNNGIAQSVQPDVSQTKMEKRSDIQGNEKDLADLLEAKNRSLAAIQEAHETQIKNLELELERERGKLSNIQLQLQEEQKLNDSFQKELNLLKLDKDKATAEMNKIRDELNQKISEMEKVELESALKAASNSSAHKVRHDTRENSMEENVQSLGSFPGKEEMELSMQKLEKDLKETRQQRDKASQELNRLKKHLLDKESEESEKMDEDNKIIEELREKNEYQRLQIQQLQKALKQSIASQDEVKMANNSELQKYKEIVEDLNRKLSSYRSMIDAKNVELLNLQTALGQYYAEIEAKEHLEGDLAHAREESTKLADLLKDAHQQGEITRKEKEDILEKLSQADRTLAEGRNRVNKLEEDNAKLRRALEQNMSRINRMSVDSDFLVDRAGTSFHWSSVDLNTQAIPLLSSVLTSYHLFHHLHGRIVIKLLVTYFQRNHSKEVLDLMVRMLGFSDEDKQRIGGAQQGTGKGVVRGVLGLPGRLVGGILGGGSAEANANTASENQSFADLWVDFLLKETEKRESAEAINASNEDQQNTSLNDTAAASPIPNQRMNSAASPASRLSPSPYQYNSPLLRGNILQPEHLDSEFSTVPLTSSEHITSQVLRPLPRY
ncbi:golgin Putative 4 [Actinidia rufa]|uniref:Golgin Putative 4 n=1 Tax=Actinidia rufa TaxID=165716 RepID=A0A7J0F1B2_9ERIC|nr:golgin Putative 4 [Actinidia rufa]